MNEVWRELAVLALVRLDMAILVYFLLVNSFYGLQLVSAALAIRRHRLAVWKESRWRVLASDLAPGISILAPAFNEEATIVESVRALLSLRYHNLELIVVNDGSKDATLAQMKEAFALVPIHPIYQRRIQHAEVVGLYRSESHPALIVVDKKNGGKADALNAGLNLASGELVCAIDADTLLEPDALQRMIRPFLLYDDVLAAGGTIRIANGSTVSQGRVVEARVPGRWIAGSQIVEYLRAFLFGRLGWNRLGGNLIVSGAFGLFRRDSVIDAGGYFHETVGEDMELVMRLRRFGYESKGAHRVEFIPDPVAWTEAPETLRVLGRQRDRWHRGLSEALWRHRGVMFNPRYGSMGLFVYPVFVFVELLAPVIEAIGILGLIAGLVLGAIDIEFAILFFLVAYGLGLLLSVATVVMEETSFRRYDRIIDRFRLLLWASLENFGYRQMTVLWRIRGIWKFLRGKRDWGAMERRGFAKRQA